MDTDADNYEEIRKKRKYKVVGHCWLMMMLMLLYVDNILMNILVLNHGSKKTYLAEKSGNVPWCGMYALVINSC